MLAPLLLTSSALGFELPTEDSGIGAEMGLMLKRYRASEADEELVFAAAPLFAGHVALTPQWGVRLRWGVAFDTDPGADLSAAFFAGNPLASTTYETPLFFIGRLKLETGLALPLSAATDNASQQLVSTLGASMRGQWNSWLWAPDALSWMARSRFEIFPLRLCIAADLGLGALFFVKHASMRDTQVAFQIASEISYFLGSTIPGSLIPGIRIQGVFRSGSGDLFQGSIAPFLRVNLDDITLFARLTINIDKPSGFSFTTEGVYGFLLGATLAFY